MTGVFIINNTKPDLRKDALDNIAAMFPELTANFDISDTALPFPCGHSILRVEGATIDSDKIIHLVKQSGLMCEILEDKVCK